MFKLDLLLYNLLYIEAGVKSLVFDWEGCFATERLVCSPSGFLYIKIIVR